MVRMQLLVCLMVILPVVFCYHRFQADEELSKFTTKLWELDENRCEPNVDYDLDLQGYVTNARQIGRKDYARHPFFNWVDEAKVFARPTYRAFRALLDNYRSETGLPEQVDSVETTENRHFIDMIMETKVMQELHSFLVKKGKAPSGRGDFKWLLYNMWFKLYRRTKGDRDFDSSGFEHVFVGETRGKEVIGFHSWIQLYLQEKQGNIDYRGYFRRGTGKEDNPRLATIQFTWARDQAKPIGSLWVGTSPEFEMALYTMVHLLGGSDKKDMRIAHYDVTVTCYALGQGVGTAYPTAQ